MILRTSSLLEIIVNDSFCNFTTGRAKICLREGTFLERGFEGKKKRNLSYPTIFSGPNARNADDVNAIPSPIEKNANLPFDQG